MQIGLTRKFTSLIPLRSHSQCKGNEPVNLKQIHYFLSFLILGVMGIGGDREFRMCVLSWLLQEAMQKGEAMLERGPGTHKSCSTMLVWGHL